MISKVYLAFTFILLQYWTTTLAKTTTGTIRIGGFFSVFKNGTVDSQQAQALAGFLMAINEVNNDTSLLPNHHVEFTIADPTGLIDATLASIDLSSDAFNGQAVDAVVGAVPNYETMTTNKILAHYNKVQVSSVARSALLSVGKDYPLKARVLPSDSFSGSVTSYCIVL
jgi:ABC-type branched-subunit amino acid transport system substrate-binding protein